MVMVESLKPLRDRIARFQQERPAYREILDFYALIVEEQAKVQAQLRIKLPALDKDLIASRLNEGIPLLGRAGFDIDLDAAHKLFHALGRIGEGTTPKMGDAISKIKEAVKAGTLDLKTLLSKHYDEDYVGHEAARWGLDQGVLSFLVNASVRPCLEAQMEGLRGSVDHEQWLRQNCPLCGSLAQIAELRDEGGKRYLQCSVCGCQWRWERVACPYCTSRDPESLQYIFSEEEGAYRVDLCDQCRGYIKTVDSRQLDYKPYLDLEDVVTIHLDILAVERGYQRPVPTPWVPITDI